jgi:glycosyltransferase involved in cell wall biosynthesis
MRILFVTYDGKTAPGAKLLCYDYAKQLSELGHDCDVFSFKEDLKARFDGAESFRTSPAERIKLSILATARLMRTHKKDILIVHKAGFHSFSAVLASLLKGNKIILFYDDFEYYTGNPLKNIFFYLVLKKASACIAISKHLQAFLESKTIKPVVYVPGGTETDVFKPLPVKKNKDVTFIWVGFADNRETLKNIFYILDAFRAVSENNKRARLELRVSGPFAAEVDEKIRKEKIRGAKTIEWIDNLPEYLNRVHVGLFQVIDDSHYSRSKSPGKLFQYMATGLPVICSNMGEAAQIVRDRKDGFLTNNKQELIDRMELLAADARLRERMGKSARERIKEGYDKKLLAKRIEGIAKRIS